MPKAMLTWLGDDDGHWDITYDRDGNEHKRPAPGPSFTYWGSIRFDKGVPVLIDSDAQMDADTRLLVDNILLRAPKMTKRYKVEPVAAEKTEGAKRGDVRQSRGLDQSNTQ